MAGVVVEPAQDLDVDASGEPVMGEVGLPHLIGLLGLEAAVGGTGPLGRSRGHQTLATQSAIDRRPRHRDVVVMLDVPADRVRPGIQALGGETLAEFDDQNDRLVGDRRR